MSTTCGLYWDFDESNILNVRPVLMIESWIYVSCRKSLQILGNSSRPNNPVVEAVENQFGHFYLVGGHDS